MKLIYIYGPPASGKLTVATALAAQTGFKLFHNHLTQDLAGVLYPEWNDVRHKLVDKLRLDVIEYAAQNNTDLIFTQYYTGDGDDIAFVNDTVEIIKSSGGTVKFVELTAPIDVLQRRVTNESRKPFEKAKDIETLQKHLDDSKFQSVEYERLTIDSSKVEPDEASRDIIESFRLNTI